MKYEYIKKKYTPIGIYISDEPTKQKIKNFAKEKNMSLRGYLIDLLFSHKEPENLQQFVAKQPYSKKKSSVSYMFLCPNEKEQELKAMAVAKKMTVSHYIMLRICMDMMQNGYSLHETQNAYIVFYKENDIERSFSKLNKKDAVLEIQKIQEKEGITDILLVDTNNMTRKAY